MKEYRFIIRETDQYSFNLKFEDIYAKLRNLFPQVKFIVTQASIGHAFRPNKVLTFVLNEEERGLFKLCFTPRDIRYKIKDTPNHRYRLAANTNYLTEEQYNKTVSSVKALFPEKKLRESRGPANSRKVRRNSDTDYKDVWSVVFELTEEEMSYMKLTVDPEPFIIKEL